MPSNTLVAKINLYAFLVLPLAAQVAVTQGPDRIDVAINGAPYTSLFYGPNAPKPYLHPLRAANGAIVTRRWPMEIVEGETHDEIHQRGLGFAHGDVNGIDYWDSDSTKKGEQPRIVLNRVAALEGGKKSGVVHVIFDWLDKDGKPLLKEDRTMTFRVDAKLRTVDFDATLTAVQKARFGDTKEGVFGIRVASQLQLPSGAIVSSTGLRDDKVWGSRADWVDYSGVIDGAAAGIAVFDHPENPQHPTYWHARGYGLFAANIFGKSFFTRDKTADGSMTLEPGESLRFRYRVVIHPGTPEEAGIAGMYRNYPTPVK